MSPAISSDGPADGHGPRDHDSYEMRSSRRQGSRQWRHACVDSGLTNQENHSPRAGRDQSTDPPRRIQPYSEAAPHQRRVSSPVPTPPASKSTSDKPQPSSGPATPSRNKNGHTHTTKKRREKKVREEPQNDGKTESRARPSERAATSARR